MLALVVGVLVLWVAAPVLTYPIAEPTRPALCAHATSAVVARSRLAPDQTPSRAWLLTSDSCHWRTFAVTTWLTAGLMTRTAEQDGTSLTEARLARTTSHARVPQVCPAAALHGQGSVTNCA